MTFSERFHGEMSPEKPCLVRKKTLVFKIDFCHIMNRESTTKLTPRCTPVRVY